MMKFKELKPKYKMIELVASNEEGTYAKAISMKDYKDLVKKYGNAEVLSVQDYDFTKTTSVIIKDSEDYKDCITIFYLK